MSHTKEELRRIWTSTAGRCHLTKRRLRLRDYGKTWEVDHSRPRATGGSDHGNNLRPATIAANRSKQAASARSVRRANGVARRPMSRTQQEQARSNNTMGGVVLGALAGAAVAGPPGALIGGLIGAAVGSSAKIE